MRASVRDTGLLFKQFQWPLLVFMLAIIGGGWMYFLLSGWANQPIATRSEAIYHVLGLTFLNPVEEFPDIWYLQIFYFVMPLIGIGILAQGFADFGVLLFNRRARRKEWEMAVASTYHGHVLLVGLGHLGFRVAQHLFSMRQDVVVVELNPKADLVDSIRQLGIPVITDDGTREVTLRGAGVSQARAIILCTQDDSLNLKMALKARSLNPDIDVVLRIFDDDFAAALEKQFGFRALSATGTASPVFAAAAAGIDMTRPITVEGQALSLACFNISNYAHLAGLIVGQVEKDFDVSVVLLKQEGGESDFHPAAERKIEIGDTLAVFGGAIQINSLAKNQPG